MTLTPRDAVEISMARDLVAMIGQGDTPLDPEERELLILSTIADTLDWVLGLENQLDGVLEDLKRQLDDAGFVIVPNPEGN